MFASLGLYYLVTFPAVCQQGFINLDFELANLPSIPAGQSGGLVPITSALPGWNGYIGDLQITQVLHNDVTIGDASVDIFGPFLDPSGILEGSYSVLLQSGGALPSPFSAAIGQIGSVRADAQLLQFKAGLGSIFTLSFAGQSLTPIALSSGPNYTLYGADIASFAGQTGELRFTAPYDPSRPNGLLLDSISFSAVPEPSVLALSALGVLLLGRRFLRWHR
jgi:hypothetical protein